MQGIFQKENTDKALKYGIYRHLPQSNILVHRFRNNYITHLSANPIAQA